MSAEDDSETGQRETLVMTNYPICVGETKPQLRLVIRAQLCLDDGSQVNVSALVDTGAEVSLIRQGLVPRQFLRRSLKPKRFIVANQMTMDGGMMEMPCNLVLEGTDVDTSGERKVVCPSVLYDADTNVDVILSYEWLRQNYIDVRCRRHGLEVQTPQGPVWIAGMSDYVRQRMTTEICAVRRQIPSMSETGQSRCVESYTVRWPFVYEIVKQFGVEPTRDCFASEGNKRCSQCYTQEDDAMSKEWKKSEIMWLNPPWCMWPQVTEKLMTSECAAICILPAWSKVWVQRVVGAAEKRIYFESGVRMFELEGKPVPNTLWGVWALKLRKGARPIAQKEDVYKDCLFVPRWRPITAMGKVSDREGEMKVEKSEVRVTKMAEGQPRMALDLFTGTGSVARELARQGYQVVSLDINPKSHATHMQDVLQWDYRHAYPRGTFEVIWASPPCEHFSQARTTAPRDLDKADALVQKTLEIIRWYKPQKWFLENPRSGLLKGRPYMEGIPWIDVDYCQFADWGYKKPTRIWGGEHLRELENQLCDPQLCRNVVERENGRLGHEKVLGGLNMRMGRKKKYRVPESLVRYLLSIPDRGEAVAMVEGLARLQLNALPEVRFGGELDYDHLEALAADIITREGMDRAEALVQGVVITNGAMRDDRAEQIQRKLLEDFKTSVFTNQSPKERPKRGPHGEATIELKPGAQPIKQRPYQIQGERREALIRMVDKLISEGKLEEGKSAWSSPAFPVPKKKPGEYRLVVDYRALNDATVVDAHPLPRIEDILQRQSRYKVWTVLDMKDGYHQIPLKKEHRHLTCMSTPKGTYQWTVLVMGLKNGGAIFQCTMEWVLKGLTGVDVYIDDVIVGSTGRTPEEVLSNHEKDVRALLERLAEHQLIVEPKKAHMFVTEVEFCGHVLREGKRQPAPGKLLSIQKWELPRTVTQLRGFLGLTNYYSSYVPNYAEYAGPLMAKLQLNRQDGKKGSTRPIVWKESEKVAFERLKEVLAQRLELFRMEPDKPFVMTTDASDKAIGAVLEQQREVVEGRISLVPVAFFSRKLAKGQLNWTPREKETYAIVSALRKWAGWIGLQPVLIRTDHKSLEDWVRERMDTPSGPAGRRARWHETLSKFDLTVQYMPGKDNIVADALSRFAYPACKAFQDTSAHGNEEARREMKEIIEEELREGRTLGMITHGQSEKRLVVAGTISKRDSIPRHRICVVTRSGAKTARQSEEEESSDDEVVELTPPTQSTHPQAEKPSGSQEADGKQSPKMSQSPPGTYGAGKDISKGKQKLPGTYGAGKDISKGKQKLSGTCGADTGPPTSSNPVAESSGTCGADENPSGRTVRHLRGRRKSNCRTVRHLRGRRKFWQSIRKEATNIKAQ